MPTSRHAMSRVDSDTQRARLDIQTTMGVFFPADTGRRIKVSHAYSVVQSAIAMLMSVCLSIHLLRIVAKACICVWLTLMDCLGEDCLSQDVEDDTCFT